MSLSIVELDAQLTAANERIIRLEALVDKWSQDACDLSGELCIERKVSDRLAMALQRIAKLRIVEVDEIIDEYVDVITEAIRKGETA